MKPKYLIALVLVLCGTNLFTFATTRYLITKAVLTRAQQRMDAALKREGLYEHLHPDNRPPSVGIEVAIRLAGGMYYWYNDALVYWGVAVLLALSGLAVARYEPRKPTAASPMR